MCEQIWNIAMPYAIGLGVALVGGQFAITGITSPLWEKLGLPNTDRYGASQSMVLGLTECTLYIGAFLIGKPEFIAVWLGLKTVIKWRHWESDVAVPDLTLQVRRDGSWGAWHTTSSYSAMPWSWRLRQLAGS